MRVVGGADFYDGAAAYGIDTEVVFVRHRDQRLDTKACPITMDVDVEADIRVTRADEWRPARAPTHWRARSRYVSGVPFHVRVEPVVVAGTLHSCVVLSDLRSHRTPEGGETTRTDYHCYTLEQVAHDLDVMGLELHEPARRRGRYGYHEREGGGSRELSAVLARKLSEAQVAWLVERRVTVMVPKRPSDPREADHWLVDAPALGGVKFGRCLDAFQTHQEIAQWVGGVLPRNPNPMVAITDDKIKIAKHGMDATSFRRPKEGAR